MFTNDELKAGAVSASSVDVVLDSVGGTLRGSCWRVLAPFGMLIAYGNASGEPEKPIAPRDLRARNQRAGGFSINALARMQPRLLSQLVQEAIATVAEGQLQIDISLVLPLDQAADAHRAVETRRSTGKVALTLDAHENGERREHGNCCLLWHPAERYRDRDRRWSPRTGAAHAPRRNDCDLPM